MIEIYLEKNEKVKICTMYTIVTVYGDVKNIEKIKLINHIKVSNCSNLFFIILYWKNANNLLK